MKVKLYAAIALSIATHLFAEPQLSSWNIGDSGRYARLFETSADEASLAWVTTWSNGQGIQSSPTYAGVHEVAYSDDWIYIRTTGLGQHIMGPWYLEGGALFPNYPANRSARYRFPRVPQDPPASPALTGLGAIGYFVDGVAMFDSRDAFSYSTSSASDATPINGIRGDGVWNRDAYVNEGPTFDSANAHQAGSQYHYHANPPALRHLLGGNVDYDEASNTYTEQSTTPIHSPLIGWVDDGHPIYGPYGYSDPADPFSEVRLMVSGYRTRSISTRQVLPAWAARVQGYTAAGSASEYTLPSSAYGPAVSATYTAGHYIEDYEYLGDLGHTQGSDFDLDEHNGRFCVTPEFPEGVYAYFTSIASDGTPRYPYNIGRAYYGDPTGAAVVNVTEEITVYAEGGPETDIAPALQTDSDDVVIIFGGVEGGSYRIESLTNLVAGSSQLLTSNSVASAEGVAFVHTNGLQDAGFYRITLDSVTAFDASGFDHDIPVSGGGAVGSGPVVPTIGSRGTTVNLTITLDSSSVPPLPPAQITPSFVTVGSLYASNIVRVNYNTVTATLTIPAGTTTGAKNVSVFFNIPSYTLTNAFTVE
jgi:hypothetical protein